MAAIKIRILGLGLLIAASTSASCNHVGDQYCEVGADLNNPTENCPFGPPGGPGDHSTSACPDIAVDPTGVTCAGLTWAGANGIWDVQLKASCSTVGTCHDTGKGTGAKGIYLPFGDATTAFANLKSYKPINYPYVSDLPTETKHTWILCNLKGQEGGGKVMPPGAKLPDLTRVEEWAKCGQVIGTNGPGTPKPDAGTGDGG